MNLLFPSILDNAAYYAQGWLDGKQDSMDNLNIVYTYHVHEGNISTTANGCYTTPVYHNHASNCYTNCPGSLTIKSSTSNQYTCTCDICGSLAYRTKHDWDSDYNVHFCNIPKISCGKSTSTIEKYILGCGKNEDTIESVTIKY